MPSKKKTAKSNRIKPSWKTVEPEDGHIAKGIPKDMIGIEELTDYRLVKTSTKTGKAQVKIVKGKAVNTSLKDNNVGLKTDVSGPISGDKPKTIEKAKDKRKRKTSVQKALHVQTEPSEGSLENNNKLAEKSENLESKAEVDEQDNNDVLTPEISAACDDTPKTSKKSKKKQKKKPSKTNIQDGSKVEEAELPLECDSKPKTTKKSKKNLKRKASVVDQKSGNDIGTKSDEPLSAAAKTEMTVEPDVKRSKGEEKEEEDEEEEEEEEEEEKHEVMPISKVVKIFI